MTYVENNTRAKSNNAGFSLIEVTVVMFVFLTIATVALTLVRRGATAYGTQQAQSAMNIALRNSIAQIQIDVMNAGTGYYPNIYVPGAPIGITISNNNPTTSCYAGGLYTAQCFDTLNILDFSTVSPTVPTATFDTSASGTMTLTPAPNATMTAAQIAAAYTSGSELMLIATSTQGSPTGQPRFMTVILSGNATYSGNNITISFTKTNKSSQACGDGTGPPCYSNPSDPYLVAKTGTGAMTSAFGVNDYALKLAVITYSVDTTTNPGDPRLVRTPQSGVASVIADRIIGFKVGAMTWGGSLNVTNPSGNDVSNYIYNPANYYYPNDFSLIRSLRVSLIGRTNIDPTNPYKNGFDNGQYRVEAVSTVVSPRNLSMLDK